MPICCICGICLHVDDSGVNVGEYKMHGSCGMCGFDIHADWEFDKDMIFMIPYTYKVLIYRDFKWCSEDWYLFVPLSLSLCLWLSFQHLEMSFCPRESGHMSHHKVPLWKLAPWIGNIFLNEFPTALDFGELPSEVWSRSGPAFPNGPNDLGRCLLRQLGNLLRRRLFLGARLIAIIVANVDKQLVINNLTNYIHINK